MTFGDVEEEKAAFFPFPDSKGAFLGFLQNDLQKCPLVAHLQSLVLLVSKGTGAAFAPKIIAAFATCPWLLSKGESAFLCLFSKL